MDPSTAKPFSSWKIIISLVLLLLVTQLTIFSVISYSVNKVNEDARKRIQGHVASVINDKLDQQAILAKDYAYWDDTIQNAYLAQNPWWIQENIGQYLTDTFHVTDLLIIKDQADPVLSLRNGNPEESGIRHFDARSLSRLIANARQSGPLPVPVSGIIMIDKTPAIVGAAVLTPEDGTTLPPPRPVLVVARRLDIDYLQTLASQYRLTDLQFGRMDKNSEVKTFIEITNPLSEPLGILSWKAEKPGNLVLSEIQLPLLSLFLISIIITIYIIRSFHTISIKLNEAYEDLAHNAGHDFLTGLANRRLFNEIMQQTTHAAKRDNISCALVHLDLDNFKQLNDTYGHQAGDQLLVSIAERLRYSVRESDFIARVGGDEFLVLLRNTSNLNDIKATVDKMLSNLKQAVEYAGNEMHITASAGIAMLPGDGTDTETLMKCADIALYRSKDKGRNTLSFYKDLA